MHWAALDIGTNTVLSLAAHDSESGLQPGEERCRTTRLGEGVDATGRLGTIPMLRTLDAVAECVDRLNRISVAGKGIAVATSAVREAANREQFLTLCHTRLGFAPKVLSGEEEARLTFLGAADDQPTGMTLVTIDIGGGSSELSAGYAGECLHAESVRLGCVRFMERFGLREATTRTDREPALENARDTLAGVRERLLRKLPEGKADRIIVSGGTATTLAAVLEGGRGYRRKAIHGVRIGKRALNDALGRIGGLPSAQRSELAGVPPGRAPVFPAGLLILLACMAAFRVSEMTVSAHGLRYGLVRSLHAGRLSPSWEW